MSNASLDSRPKMDIINGSSRAVYEVLGAHPAPDGTRFAVWAPWATKVSLVGDFNRWNRDADPMELDRCDTGIWELVRPVPVGGLYKYCINDDPVFRADPVAFYTERGPDIASIVTDLGGYTWQDQDWRKKREAIENIQQEPISIYELHLGGWRRPGKDLPTFREIVDELIEYVLKQGYNYVEPMPVSEHRPYESWGYQTTGYFAPTSNYGSPSDGFPHGKPDDFMYFVDRLHQAGIGIIFDWTPSHFSRWTGGLEMFDGSHLYENFKSNPNAQHQTIWTWPAPGTLFFNYRHGAVRSFLNSVMPFWIEKYHIDGFRLDALYGAYNMYLGKDAQGKDINKKNYAGINCIKQLNHTVHTHYRNIFISTEGLDWHHLTSPLSESGSDFDLKWSMGWHFDIMNYLSQETRETEENYRRLVHIWDFSQQERHILELSHDDEPTPRKLKREDDTQKRDTLKTLFTFLFAFPGKKLIFMGRDFGQTSDWSIFHELDWKEAGTPNHAALLLVVAELNKLYREIPALYKKDLGEGFSWVEREDPEYSVIAFQRQNGEERILAMFNFSTSRRHHKLSKLSAADGWERIFSSDAACFGGADGGFEKLAGQDEIITLPPLSGMLYRAKKPIT